MNRALLGLAAAGLALVTNGASAQTGETQSAAMGDFNISLTPRLQYLFVNSSDDSSNRTKQESYETVRFPFYGLTIGIQPRTLENIDFLITPAYGRGSGEFTAVQTTGARSGDFELERFDLEVMGRYRPSEGPASLFAGIRYIAANVDSELKSPAGDTYSSTGTRFLKEESRFYLAEIGGGVAGNIGNSDKHALFANLIFAAGYSTHEEPNALPGTNRDKSGFAAMVDANFGYQHAFSQTISAHARYRALVIGAREINDPIVVHGPEIGMTFRF